MKVPIVFTVCVCTYNRADSLARTLESFCAAIRPQKAWELLLIDNNSKDHTAEVARRFADRLPLRYVFEARQGLSAARNRAVAEFCGATLLFTDDDVRVGPNWLTAYERAIAAHPEADYFGGRILPDWNGPRPRWLREKCLPSLDGVLVWFDHGSETRLFREGDPTPFGASFGLRRSLIERVGAFRLDLGCNGATVGRSEETDILLKARALGARGAYVGEALCWHVTDRRRLTLRSLFRYGVAAGKAHKAIAARAGAGSRFNAGLCLVRGGYQLLKGRGDRFRQCVINAGIEMGMRD